MAADHVHVVVMLSVIDAANVERVAGLLERQAALSREEPGCVRFEVFHSTNDPAVFVLVETWANAAALAQHREAEAFKTLYEPEVLPLVERTPHPSSRIA